MSADHLLPPSVASIVSITLMALAPLACTPDQRGATSGTSIGNSGLTTTGPGGSGTGTDGSGGGSGGLRLDVGEGGSGGGPGDCPGGAGTGGGGQPEFSYIWIANSPEGTVSKIDTYTGQELARYRTGPPELDPQPSRTSVNLYGDVAISNRGTEQGAGGPGSVTKIVARLDDCVDKNNDGMIQTSSGPMDVLPWGSDECVVWNTPIPSTGYQRGPRPTAWEGSVSDGGCAEANPRLWIGWYDQAANTGKFHRLDGATGAILDSVDVPDWTGLTFGPYGGAVDRNGDFWASGWQQGHLVRIDGTDPSQVDVYPFPTPPDGTNRWSYGMALDQYGNPWIASQGWAAYFDAQTRTWGWVELNDFGVRGVMVDGEDRAWFAIDQAGPSGDGGCGVAIVDVKTRTLINELVKLPGCSTPVGVAIDVEGFVWVVDQTSNQAFKLNPDTLQVELTVAGLNAPYTYSDMTGAGLSIVTFPPQG